MIRTIDKYEYYQNSKANKSADLYYFIQFIQRGRMNMVAVLCQNCDYHKHNIRVPSPYIFVHSSVIFQYIPFIVIALIAISRGFYFENKAITYVSYAVKKI